MVSETTGFSWNKSDFTPFIELVLNAFGTERVLYGSDWPVCLLAANYQEQLTIVKDHIITLSETEQAKVMGINTMDFYNLGAAI